MGTLIRCLPCVYLAHTQKKTKKTEEEEEEKIDDDKKKRALVFSLYLFSSLLVSYSLFFFSLCF